MKDAGFKPVEKSKQRRIFCMTQGNEKCGKTDWAFRYTPAPIGCISLDLGTQEVAEKFIESKEVYLCSEEIPNAGQDKAKYEVSWNRILTAHNAIMKNPEIRTYIWDTGSEIWELLRLARFGKLTQVMPHHYGPLNDEFRKMIKGIAVNRPDMNFIAIHKNKKEYRESKKKEGTDSWTGRYERRGFDDFRFLVDIVLEHGYERDYYDDGTGAFSVRVVDELGVGARSTAALAGRKWVGEECTFFHVAMEAYPDVDLEYWDDRSPDHPLRMG
jgi:hypothetical protein